MYNNYNHIIAYRQSITNGSVLGPNGCIYGNIGKRTNYSLRSKKEATKRKNRTNSLVTAVEYTFAKNEQSEMDDCIANEDKPATAEVSTN